MTELAEREKHGYTNLTTKPADEESLVTKTAAAKEAKHMSTLNAFKSLLMASPLNILLPLVPLGIAGPRIGWSDTVVFAVNFLAMLPLAKLLGNCTEDIAVSVGETLGGLLNASFGNAVEMLLSIFALKEGLVDVVQGSLLGSIYSNLLLVLGMCFFFGGVLFHTQKYNADGARVQSNLLLLSVLAMVIPSLVALASSKQEQSLAMSRGAAIILSCLYCGYLFFQLGTHTDYFSGEEGGEGEEEHMHPILATVLLFTITIIIALSSEALVGSVEGITEHLGISKHFIGVILLPIVGNAAEHLTAVSVAMKNKMDLSLGVALGSSLQIALLVVPFTVITGWIIEVPMDLNFHPLGTGILLLTVLIVGSLTSDGESNWLEGAMLIAAYVMIGITFWSV
jgi:Ca2+:H+ antiporter